MTFFLSLADSCEVQELFKNTITSCFDFYSPTKEEKGTWIYPRKMNGSSVLCPENWEYNADRTFGGFDSWGRFAVYSGGGYIANLGYNRLTAKRIINDLKENRWIDRQTRAVLVEFSLYNPPSNLFAVMTYYFEVLPSGFAVTFKSYGILSLSATNSLAHSTYLLFVLLFGILLVCFFVVQCIKLCRQKCSYFKSMWNLLDMLQILTASSAMLLQWMRTKVATKTFEKLKDNPYLPVSFHRVLLLLEFEEVAICVTTVIATLRILKCFYFNPKIIVFTKTLRRLFKPIASFFIVFLIAAMAHALLGFIAFGSSVEMFAQVHDGISFQFLMLLGQPFPVDKLKEINPIIGSLFFFTFFCSTSVIILNMFLAVINEYYATSNADREGEDYELAQFIIKRILETVFGQKSERNQNWRNHELFEPDSSPAESSSNGVQNDAFSPEWTPVMYRSCTQKISRTGGSPAGNSEDFVECSVWETYGPEHLLVKSSTAETGFTIVNHNKFSSYVADARRYSIMTDWNALADYYDDDDGEEEDGVDDDDEDDDEGKDDDDDDGDSNDDDEDGKVNNDNDDYDDDEDERC